MERGKKAVDAVFDAINKVIGLAGKVGDLFGKVGSIVGKLNPFSAGVPGAPAPAGSGPRLTARYP